MKPQKFSQISGWINRKLIAFAFTGGSFSLVSTLARQNYFFFQAMNMLCMLSKGIHMLSQVGGSGRRRVGWWRGIDGAGASSSSGEQAASRRLDTLWFTAQTDSHDKQTSHPAPRVWGVWGYSKLSFVSLCITWMSKKHLDQRSRRKVNKRALC